MWSDSETSVDYLGFDLLIDTIQILVTDRALRPVTIGIDGTWGSGKTSLMEMVSEAVEASEAESLKTIKFSPWIYEDYDDTKYALIDAILDVVVENSSDDEIVEKANRVRVVARALVNYRSAVTKLVALGTGAGVALAGAPEAAPHAAASAAAVAEGGLNQLEKMPTDDEANDDAVEATTVAGLRELLTELLSTLPDELHLITFVDDVDRCLPDTVVRTFEVMRLFSDIPQVTFVIAADRGIVEESISARYRTLGFETKDRPIGRDYLEKMWNVTVKIPPLSGPEVETYLALLSCQRHHENHVGALTQRARERRAQFDTLQPGDINELIGDPSEAFQDDWMWIAATADIIATMHETHPGNPRQIKRFANRLVLGTQLLDRRGFEDVNPGVLVKLMLLEEQDWAGFNILMQNAIGAGDGSPEMLDRWEGAHADIDDADPAENVEGAAAAEDHGADVDLESQTQFFKDWLTLEPPLAGVDLRPYLYVARDQSSLARDARNLSAAAEAVMAALGGRAGTDAHTTALADFAALDSGDRALMVTVLKRLVARQPAAKTTDALLSLAKKYPNHVPAAIEALRGVPPALIKASLVAKVAAALQDYARTVRPLLEGWSESAGTELARTAAAERAASFADEE